MTSHAYAFLTCWRVDRPSGSAHTYSVLVYTHQGGPVRTNIDIDDRLMREALRRTGLKTKRATVEAGLRLLVAIDSQSALRRLRGQVRWEGNLDEMRRLRG